jgi:hypothetical protein
MSQRRDMVSRDLIMADPSSKFAIEIRTAACRYSDKPNDIPPSTAANRNAPKPVHELPAMGSLRRRRPTGTYREYGDALARHQEPNADLSA